MRPGRSQPSLVMDVQVLVTHADCIATMARGPEGTMDGPPETEASCEEIER
jgi:hypothetical protein